MLYRPSSTTQGWQETSSDWSHEGSNDCITDFPTNDFPPKHRVEEREKRKKQQKMKTDCGGRVRQKSIEQYRHFFCCFWFKSWRPQNNDLRWNRQAVDASELSKARDEFSDEQKVWCFCRTAQLLYFSLNAKMPWNVSSCLRQPIHLVSSGSFVSSSSLPPDLKRPWMDQPASAQLSNLLRSGKLLLLIRVR